MRCTQIREKQKTYRTQQFKLKDQHLDLLLLELQVGSRWCGTIVCRYPTIICCPTIFRYPTIFRHPTIFRCPTTTYWSPVGVRQPPASRVTHDVAQDDSTRDSRYDNNGDHQGIPHLPQEVTGDLCCYGGFFLLSHVVGYSY